MLNTMWPRAGKISALLLATATPGVAQGNVGAASSGPPWDWVSVVGFGGLGFGVGVWAAWDMPADAFGPSGAALATISSATLLGVGAGAIIGNRARRLHAQEQSLHPAHQLGLVTGSILAGATLGAAASVPLIARGDEGTPLGTDERTFALLTTGGAALGALYAAKHWSEIRGSKVNINPILHGPGKYSLLVQWRY